MKFLIFALGIAPLLLPYRLSAYTPGNPKFIVESEQMKDYGMTIIPSPHGAVFITTPYDADLSVHFLEKMNIPPQFNGLKTYANPSDDRLPNPSPFITSSSTRTPNATFSKTAEDIHPSTKKEHIKANLKDNNNL